MSVERFLDTNILLYAYDLDSPAKRAIAGSFLEQAWMKPESPAISVQVLQEFFVSAVRKGASASEATTLIHDFCFWKVIDHSLQIFELGLANQTR